MNAEEKNGYFQELTLNLQHEGFAKTGNGGRPPASRAGRVNANLKL